MPLLSDLIRLMYTSVSCAAPRQQNTIPQAHNILENSKDASLTEDKCMVPFTQWMEDLIALVAYEWIAYRTRLCMDKYKEIWNSFGQNTEG